MKRFISLLLVSLLLLPLAACGESNPPADTSSDTTADTSTESPETDPVEEDPGYDFGFIPDGLPETMDFDGAEFTVSGGSSVTSDELGSTELSASIYNTSREIEKRFSCVIQPIEGFKIENLEQLVATGDTSYDVIAADALSLSQSLVRGFYYNLSSIEQFDFDQPWWTAGTKELSIGDRVYLGVSYLQYNGMDGMYILFSNKDVAERYNVTLPYEDVFNGTWTMDKLTTLASQVYDDLNGDGIMGLEDAYGFSFQSGFCKQLQCSLGVHIIAKDENNYPVMNLDLQAAIDYLTAMESLYPYSGIIPYNAGLPFLHYFDKGNTLFVHCDLNHVYSIMNNTEIVYGFLPVPKLTEDQESYRHYSHSGAWIIPTTAEDTAFIGTIAEALNAAHYNTVRPVYIESALKGRFSDTPEDTRVLDIISNTMWADFGFEYSQTITPIWDIRDIQVDYSSTNIASVYRSVEKRLNSVLNKQFIKRYNEMIEDEQ